MSAAAGITAKNVHVNGVRLNIEEAGSGQPLVMLHGLASNVASLRNDLQAFSDRYRTIAIDCRGHGASDKPKGPYTTALFADDLADVMDHLGWEKAVVAGASMGGTVAITFGQKYPQRTAGLGLFDTTAWYGETAPKDWAERAQKAAEEGLASLIGFQKTRWFSDAFREQHADVVQSCIDVFLRNDAAAYVAGLFRAG